MRSRSASATNTAMTMYGLVRSGRSAPRRAGPASPPRWRRTGVEVRGEPVDRCADRCAHIDFRRCRRPSWGWRAGQQRRARTTPSSFTQVGDGRGPLLRPNEAQQISTRRVVRADRLVLVGGEDCRARCGLPTAAATYTAATPLDSSTVVEDVSAQGLRCCPAAAQARPRCVPLSQQNDQAAPASIVAAVRRVDESTSEDELRRRQSSAGVFRTPGPCQTHHLAVTHDHGPIAHAHGLVEVGGLTNTTVRCRSSSRVVRRSLRVAAAELSGALNGSSIQQVSASEAGARARPSRLARPARQLPGQFVPRSPGPTVYPAPSRPLGPGGGRTTFGRAARTRFLPHLAVRERRKVLDAVLIFSSCASSPSASSPRSYRRSAAAGHGLDQPVEHPQHGRLPGPGQAHDHEELARRDLDEIVVTAAFSFCSDSGSLLLNQPRDARSAPGTVDLW